jgi:hypothetical protein
LRHSRIAAAVGLSRIQWVTIAPHVVTVRKTRLTIIPEAGSAPKTPSSDIAIITSRCRRYTGYERSPIVFRNRL